MKLRGFIAPFVLITTFFVVAATASAVIYFKPFQLKTIQLKTFSLPGLSAVRDIKGEWEGKASHTLSAGEDTCVFGVSIVLKINEQSKNSIAGSFTETVVSGNSDRCFDDKPYTVPFRADISGSRIVNLTPGILGTFSGSYTQDTITLNQTTAGVGEQGQPIIITTVKLLRK